MKKIALNRGEFALVDNADYNWLNQWKWYAHRTGGGNYIYAVRGVGDKHNRKHEYMHRIILGLQSENKRHTDHIDGNGLNNQRSNLRVCTGSQNAQNARKCKVKTTSKYKGVDWWLPARKWRSRIWVNKKGIYLGCFDLETTAARAYNKAASKYFGEFAKLNVI